MQSQELLSGPAKVFGEKYPPPRPKAHGKVKTRVPTAEFMGVPGRAKRGAEHRAA